ncbi:MAG: hypothetical protein JSS43_17420 [Proteobacteria bacterium]|nr:hypothetical protein [Pseudomonadota bacterium]
MRALLVPALALVLAAGGLAGCGKKGPPDPPGPPEKVFWPRTYPSPTPPQR